ncbi:hypothetical protein MUK42_27873 [Musa troglodytarum]|uniref:NAC domain-containing protein n=1 Tax=Musa troglodytarum TaxID=320322 RepID=A0A9E7F4P0_9LILI|nr:hypothetical protein MUK42_27873 [Musa troglodytarum]
MASEGTSDDGGETWRSVGCQFTPTDEELLGDCLLNKVRNLPLRIPSGFSIPEMEVYKKSPWELMVPSSYLPTGVSYCFVRVPRSKAKDNRLKRKTRGGTWVANGKPRHIPHQDRRTAIAGTRRSLKFFKDSGDPRKKNKKDSSLGLKWIMHEYRLHPSLYETIPSYETEEIILCRIQHKGRGAADKSDDDDLLAKAPPVADTQPVVDTQQTPEPWMAGPSTQSMAIDVPGCSWDQCGIGATAGPSTQSMAIDVPGCSWDQCGIGATAGPSTQSMAIDFPGCSWDQCGIGATEQVAWMTAAPAIQGAMADVFGCYRVPDTGVLGKEPSCGVPLRRQKRGLAMTFLDFMTTSTLQRRPHL